MNKGEYNGEYNGESSKNSGMFKVFLKFNQIG